MSFSPLETMLIGFVFAVLSAVVTKFFLSGSYVKRGECDAHKAGCAAAQAADGKSRDDDIEDIKGELKRISQRQTEQAKMMLLLMKELKIPMDKQMEVVA